MKTIKLNGKIKGTVLALSLVLGFGIMSSTSAHAQEDRSNGQWQHHDRNHNVNQEQNRDWRHSGNRNHDVEQNSSHRDERDERYGNNGGYDRNRVYGNNRGYGNRGGYNNGNYNNSYRVALDQGYQAGLNVGANDAERGQNYNPQRSHYFRDASSQPFRDGFVRGYEAGFSQYGGYNNRNDGYRRERDSGMGSILGGILGRP